jgi:3-phenylpropionate/trans-cinnamate dioxygenase ferredoxin subunit
MPVSSFIAAANTSEIPDPGSMLVEVDERLVVLIHAAGHYYALDDVCTHDGGPLSDGLVEVQEGSRIADTTIADTTIACPRHGAKFDALTGAAATMPATQATVAHEVKVDGDQIFVRLSDH